MFRVFIFLLFLVIIIYINWPDVKIPFISETSSMILQKLSNFESYLLVKSLDKNSSKIEKSENKTLNETRINQLISTKENKKFPVTGTGWVTSVFNKKLGTVLCDYAHLKTFQLNYHTQVTKNLIIIGRTHLQ